MTIDERDIDRFEAVGAAVLRSVISIEWIERVQTAIDAVMDDPDRLASTEKGFYNGFFAWRQNAVIRDFLFDSPLPDIAARFLSA